MFKRGRPRKRHSIFAVKQWIEYTSDSDSDADNVRKNVYEEVQRAKLMRRSQEREDNLPNEIDPTGSEEQDENLPNEIDPTGSQEQEYNLPNAVDPTGSQEQEDNLPHEMEPTEPQQLDDNLQPQIRPTEPQQLDDNLPPQIRPTEPQQLDDNLQPQIRPTEPQQFEDNSQPQLRPTEPQQFEDNSQPQLRPTEPQQFEDNLPRQPEENQEEEEMDVLRDDDSDFSNDDENDGEGSDDYHDILQKLKSSWIMSEIHHSVSKGASESFWRIGLELFPKLSGANGSKKTPQFNYIRKKMYKDMVPNIDLEIGYKNRSSGEITVVNTTVTPVKNFSPAKFDKMFEIATVKVHIFKMFLCCKPPLI